jgi:hypothetical protein
MKRALGHRAEEVRSWLLRLLPRIRDNKPLFSRDALRSSKLATASTLAARARRSLHCRGSRRPT